MPIGGVEKSKLSTSSSTDDLLRYTRRRMIKWKSLPGKLRNKTYCVKNDERITLATNHDHLVFALCSL